MRRLISMFSIGVALVTGLSAASVDGVAIHSTSSGTGTKALVFVHGWTCDLSSWSSQIPAFASKYRVLALDLPGHGKSGAPAPGAFSIDLFARAVESVRAEAGVDRIVLIGHSMGAPVIRQYARLFPQHVAGLVAVDGPLDMRGFGGPGGQPPPVMTGPEGLKRREGMIKSMFTAQTPAPIQQHVLTMMLKAPEATAAGAMAAMGDPALRRDDVTNVPALAVLAGSNRMPDVEATRKVLPQFEATQIAGTGHFLMMEKPDEFNRTLTAFLDKIKY